MDPNAFVTDCWVNITKKGGQQVIHTHANAFVSGTYYLHLEDGVGGIAFNNPNIHNLIVLTLDVMLSYVNL